VDVGSAAQCRLVKENVQQKILSSDGLPTK